MEKDMRYTRRCFICRNHCLNIKGQDAALDTTYLNKENIYVQEIIKARAEGYVHLSCLINSDWGLRWSKALAESALANEIAIFVSPSVSITKDKNSKNIFVVAANGWHMDIPTEYLYQYTVYEGFYALPTRTELGFGSGGEEKVAEQYFELERLYAEGRKFTLDQVVKGMGIAQYLWAPQAINGFPLESVQHLTYPNGGGRRIFHCHHHTYIPHNYFLPLLENTI